MCSDAVCQPLPENSIIRFSVQSAWFEVSLAPESMLAQSKFVRSTNYYKAFYFLTRVNAEVQFSL